MPSLLVLVAAALDVATGREEDMASVLVDTSFVPEIVPVREVDSVVPLKGADVLKPVVIGPWLVDMVTAWSVEVFSLASSLSRRVVVIFGSGVDHGRS